MTRPPGRSRQAAPPLQPSERLQPAPVSPREWGWLLTIALCGLVLRTLDLSQSAVEHFDEAVYASNLLFGASGGEWPGRPFFAPPLLPAAIEWTEIVGSLLGVRTLWWPLLPVWLCGVATPVSLWWIGRQQFGQVAGLTAAAIVAFSGIHSAYSASALTDVPLALALLWGVYWFWRALADDSPRDAVIAGLIAAAAWWIKYNGWLVLAIGISGGLAAELIAAREQRRLGRWLRISTITSVVALLAWSPVWWWDAARVGGYAEIMANHRGYVHGINQWPGAAWQQLTAIASYRLLWPAVALCLISVLFAFAHGFFPVSIAAAMAALGLGGGGAVGLLGLGWGITSLPSLWKEHRPATTPPNHTADASRLAWALTFAAVLGLSLSIPYYRPYPRLVLPWEVFSAFLYGALVARSLRSSDTIAPAGKVAWKAISYALLMCGVVANADISRLKFASYHNGNRFSAVKSAARISERLRDLNGGEPPLTLLTGDPALLHHLQREHDFPAALVADLRFLDQPLSGPAYLIVGYQAQRDTQFQAEWELHQDRFELIDEFKIQPSRMVLFDLFSPSEIEARPELRSATQRVYRLK